MIARWAAVTRTAARRTRGERGTSAVEYSLLVVAIAAVIAAIVFSVGIKIKAAFDGTCHSIATAQNANPAPPAKPGGQPAIKAIGPTTC